MSDNEIKIAEIKLTEEEIEAAVAVMRSGALRQGPQCEAFEKEFAKKVGAKFAATSSNGTAALHLAYLAFLKPEDEVLVPAFTFFATASAVSLCGGKPVFCDVDEKSFLLDLKDAESKITPKTKAISPVHLFGNACDNDKIVAFAKKHNLIIVWDAAQAHGTKYNGRDVGSFGDFVAYSFYPTKNMFVGEGGMTTCDNPDFDAKMKFMRSHGQTGYYYHTMIGYNYRMTDVEAAIGRKQLERLDEMVATRRRNAAILNEGLSKLKGLTPQQATRDSEHSYHQYCIILEPDKFGCDRDELSKRLKEKNIVSAVHYPRGLHQQPIFEQTYGKITLPVTEHLARNILALPVHHGLSADQAKRIVTAVKEISDR